jgi:hypothetical protein
MQGADMHDETKYVDDVCPEHFIDVDYEDVPSDGLGVGLIVLVSAILGAASGLVGAYVMLKFFGY